MRESLLFQRYLGVFVASLLIGPASWALPPASDRWSHAQFQECGLAFDRTYSQLLAEARAGRNYLERSGAYNVTTAAEIGFGTFRMSPKIPESLARAAITDPILEGLAARLFPAKAQTVLRGDEKARVLMMHGMGASYSNYLSTRELVSLLGYRAGDQIQPDQRNEMLPELAKIFEDFPILAEAIEVPGGGKLKKTFLNGFGWTAESRQKNPDQASWDFENHRPNGDWNPAVAAEQIAHYIGGYLIRMKAETPDLPLFIGSRSGSGQWAILARDYANDWAARHGLKDKSGKTLKIVDGIVMVGPMARWDDVTMASSLEDNEKFSALDPDVIKFLEPVVKSQPIWTWTTLIGRKKDQTDPVLILVSDHEEEDVRPVEIENFRRIVQSANEQGALRNYGRPPVELHIVKGGEHNLFKWGNHSRPPGADENSKEVEWVNDRLVSAKEAYSLMKNFIQSISTRTATVR